MSYPENRALTRTLAGIWLPGLLMGSLCMTLAAQAQVRNDRTRPPQPSPSPSSTPPAPRSSPPAPSSTPTPAPRPPVSVPSTSPPIPRPPTSTPSTSPPSRSTGNGGGSERAPAPPGPKSGGAAPNPGKGADFDSLFGGGKRSSGDTSPRTSHSSEAADKLNKANGGDRDARTHPTTSSGSSLPGAQNGAAHDRFQRTLEGATYSASSSDVVFAPYYPYSPYYGPNDGGYFPYPVPFPYPSPYPPYPPDPYPAPDDRPQPDDRNNPDDYRIGEQDKKVDPLVEKAAQEIRTAWLNSDLDLLSKHIRRDIEIEIYTGKKLDKTLDASDFLSDVRYAFDTKTVQFQIESITPITRRVYKMVAKRTTREAQGIEHTTTLRYTLEKMDGAYIITRIDNDD